MSQCELGGTCERARKISGFLFSDVRRKSRCSYVRLLQELWPSSVMGPVGEGSSRQLLGCSVKRGTSPAPLYSAALGALQDGGSRRRGAAAGPGRRLQAAEGVLCHSAPAPGRKGPKGLSCSPGVFVGTRWDVNA